MRGRRVEQLGLRHLWPVGERCDVTMVQRSSAHIVKSDSLLEIGLSALYSEEAVASGMTTEKADLVFASVPFRILPGSGFRSTSRCGSGTRTSTTASRPPVSTTTGATYLAPQLSPPRRHPDAGERPPGGPPPQLRFRRLKAARPPGAPGRTGSPRETEGVVQSITAPRDRRPFAPRSRSGSMILAPASSGVSPGVPLGTAVPRPGRRRPGSPWRPRRARRRDPRP